MNVQTLHVDNLYTVGPLADVTSADTDATILNSQMLVEKTPDQIIVKTGDRIPYKITYTNIGDVTITKMIILDQLPEDLILDESSLIIENGGTSQTGDLFTGLTLVGVWEPGSIVTVLDRKSVV